MTSNRAWRVCCIGVLVLFWASSTGCALVALSDAIASDAYDAFEVKTGPRRLLIRPESAVDSTVNFVFVTYEEEFNSGPSDAQEQEKSFREPILGYSYDIQVEESTSDSITVKLTLNNQPPETIVLKNGESRTVKVPGTDKDFELQLTDPIRLFPFRDRSDSDGD